MSLQHILLGLLNDMPSSGYDLNKRLQAEAQHFWVTDQSQIYRALYKMQEEGWVNFELVLQQENPNKKVYHITDMGKLELESWIHSSQTDNSLSYLWLARLYFGANLSQSELHTLLKTRLETAEQFQEKVQSQLRLLDSPNNLASKKRRLTLEYSLQMLEKEIAWLKSTLESLSR